MKHAAITCHTKKNSICLLELIKFLNFHKYGVDKNSRLTSMKIYFSISTFNCYYFLLIKDFHNLFNHKKIITNKKIIVILIVNRLVTNLLWLNKSKCFLYASMELYLKTWIMQFTINRLFIFFLQKGTERNY